MERRSINEGEGVDWAVAGVPLGHTGLLLPGCPWAYRGSSRGDPAGRCYESGGPRSADSDGIQRGRGELYSPEGPGRVRGRLGDLPSSRPGRRVTDLTRL